MERADLFTVIHKAIRTMLYDLGATIQSADFTEDSVIEDVALRTEFAISMLDEHAEHEDLRVFPILRPHDAPMADTLDKEHRALEAREKAVLDCIQALRTAEGNPARIAAGNALHTAYNDMTAYCLTHMSHEEELALPATWAYLNDEQIIAIRTNIQMNTPPMRYAEWLKLMLPSMNINEMSVMVAGVKANVPPPVFDVISNIAVQSLGSERWDAVKQRAGI